MNEYQVYIIALLVADFLPGMDGPCIWVASALALGFVIVGRAPLLRDPEA